MFTPDTPKRTQVAACMKIVSCFLEKNGISGRDVVALKKVSCLSQSLWFQLQPRTVFLAQLDVTPENSLCYLQKHFEKRSCFSDAKSTLTAQFVQDNLLNCSQWFNLSIGSIFCQTHSRVKHNVNLSIYGSICQLVQFLLDKTVEPFCRLPCTSQNQ